MPPEFLEQIEFWHWLIAAVVLFVLEIFAPGFVLLWLAVAAAVVGLSLLVLPDLSWQAQGLIFAVLSVVTVVGWRLIARKMPAETDHPTLNRRGQQYVGRRFTLDQDIVNGAGSLKVGDSRWNVRGDDMPAGTDVTVTGVDGNFLTVERAGG